MYVSKFNFEAKSLGSNITRFTDLTSYPQPNNYAGAGSAGYPDATNECGRFLILSNDGFNSDFKIEYYDNSIPVDPVEFELSLADEKHDGIVLLVPEWTQFSDVPIPFSAGDICVYQGKYYHYVGSSSGISDSPDIDADWLLLTDYTNAVLYGHVIDLINDKSDHIAWDVLAINYGCNDHIVYELKCHEAKVKVFGTDGTEYLKVTITEYDDTVLTNWDNVIFNNSASDSEMQFNLSVDKDQFYIIKISKFDNTDAQIDDDIFLVYHTYCDLVECYTDLVQSVYCCECPSDPCDSAELKKMDRKYMNLVRLQSLYFSVMQMVHVESIRYLSGYTMEQSRKDYITKAQEYIEKINLIVSRCDDCNNATEDYPCNNC